MAPVAVQAPVTRIPQMDRVLSLPVSGREASFKKGGRTYRPSANLPPLATSLRARDRLSGRGRSNSADARSKSKDAHENHEVRKPSKALLAVQKARQFELAATSIQRMWKANTNTDVGSVARNVAIIRMIYAEARKRHQLRESYQKREEARTMQARRVKDGDAPAKPTLWQLMQCRDILKEAMEDIRVATKVVVQAVSGVRIFKEIAEEKACSKENSLRDTECPDDDDSVDGSLDMDEPCSPNSMYAKLSREIDEKLDREEAHERTKRLAQKTAEALGLVIEIPDQVEKMLHELHANEGSAAATPIGA
eukprot:CAMPEP_0178438304 /NCGR_PEP_ID=MMETSP0689_2-20121128/35518_1 /TAXON_ID=160604 /ORGANISM="Amphidinium massartii, Strain CS-259" /LENGTH=307 /DNA_ID=CAMNT_0020060691 /DNA_START=56 /DNA_END=979 /DNA_ORIENTATION=-